MTRKRTWGAGIKQMRTAWEAKFRMKVKAMSDSKSGELPSPPLNESSESVTLLNCCQTRKVLSAKKRRADRYHVGHSLHFSKIGEEYDTDNPVNDNDDSKGEEMENRVEEEENYSDVSFIN